MDLPVRVPPYRPPPVVACGGFFERMVASRSGRNLEVLTREGMMSARAVEGLARVHVGDNGVVVSVLPIRNRGAGS